MSWFQTTTPLKMTGVTLLAGAVGAVLGWAANAPVYMLLGPALAVSLTGLSGVGTALDHRLRDVCFVVLGVVVGSGFNDEALAAMLRWPLAFVFLALVIWAIMVACRGLLVRLFGFDRRSALLASAPGHLSFVIAMAGETGTDVARISITQSVRLLSLTLVVPFVAIAMCIDVSGTLAPPGAAMAAPAILVVLVLSVCAGLVFQWLSLPAPLLLGAMVVSAGGHMSGLVPGVLPGWMVLPAYLVLGSLIGTRFSGVTFAHLTSGLAAGVAGTLVAVTLAGLGALPVTWALGMPVAHVLIAFAPGGLETMIAMGVVLGVVPGFVVACHIARLLVLTVLLPAMLGRAEKRRQSPEDFKGTP